MKVADPKLIVASARSWLGTPYHEQASLRGVGCDCLGLARGVWRDVVGPEPFPIPPYSRDWGETGPREVLAEGARRMMPEIAPSDVVPFPTYNLRSSMTQPNSALDNCGKSAFKPLRC